MTQHFQLCVFRTFLFISSLGILESMQLNLVNDSICNWQHLKANPVIYWLNNNQILERRKVFYQYMQNVNFDSKRIKGLDNSVFRDHSNIKSSVSYNAQMISNYIYAIWIAHSNYFDRYYNNLCTLYKR